MPHTVDEIHDLLRHHNALIVHFSGVPKGVGLGKKEFPCDLRDAINGSAAFHLSCSIILPPDRFSLFGETPPATGMIGIILDISSPDSITYVSHTDGGSYYDQEGTKHPIQDVTAANCKASIVGRIGYNEWAVRNYLVRGIFVFPQEPMLVWKDGRQQECPNVWEEFGDLPIITYQNGDLFHFKADRTFSPISHADLYNRRAALP